MKVFHYITVGEEVSTIRETDLTTARKREQKDGHRSIPGELEKGVFPYVFHKNPEEVRGHIMADNITEAKKLLWDS